MEHSQEPAQQWDHRYQESERLWSGNVNAALKSTVQHLEPGTALDMGCGEGADVIWLAQQGWQATGVDISTVAIERATAAAKERGLDEHQTRFVTGDVTSWQSPERFELVAASFLHSHGTFDRDAALANAKRHVAPNGVLLVVSHATFPPWARAQHEEQQADHDPHKHDSTTPESELELLQFDPAEWTVEVAETQSRQATGPDGQQATLDDTVVMARRNSSA